MPACFFIKRVIGCVLIHRESLLQFHVIYLDNFSLHPLLLTNQIIVSKLEAEIS